jgi:hypothetical protein
MGDDGKALKLRPGTVSAACWLILAVAVMMGAWAFVTWSRMGPFDTAVHAVFDPDPEADTTVGYLELVFVTGPILSFAFALAFLILANGDSRARNWARVCTWIVSVLAFPLALVTYVNNGRTYILDIDTGPNDTVARQLMAKLNALTPWRFSGWYHTMTVGLGVVIAGCLVAVVVLLATPTARAYFRRPRAAPGLPLRSSAV